MINVQQLAIGGYDNNFAYFLVAESKKSSAAALSENFDPHVQNSTLRSKFSCRLASEDFLDFAGEKQIYVVDPDNLELIEKEIVACGYKPIGVLITHSHFDHLNGTPEFVQQYKVPVFIHKNAAGKSSLKNLEGMEVRFLEDGEKIMLAGNEIEVMHTPGHIDDAVCYHFDGKLITGDTLFVGACGRADLEGSNAEDLYKSLQKIAALPDETGIYPGHDYGEKPTSTIGWEKEHNKYLQCSDLQSFMDLRLSR